MTTKTDAELDACADWLDYRIGQLIESGMSVDEAKATAYYEVNFCMDTVLQEEDDDISF